jgi:hypothetical protein
VIVYRYKGTLPGPRKAENDAERCIGIYGEKYKGDPAKIGQRCECRAVDGSYCRNHAEVPDEKRCRGHLSKNHPTNPGGRCPQPAMGGLHVCYRHGGNAPQARKAAKRRINEARVEAKAMKILEAHGITPVTNPLQELQELAGRAKANMEKLDVMVDNLAEIRYESQIGQEQLRAEVALLERAQAFFRQILVDMAKLNLDERLVRVEEGKAAAIIDVINATLDHAGITGQKAAASREFAARRLEAVA